MPIYKTLPDYPGYRIGDDGSIWSCRRRIGIPGRRGGTSVVITGDWQPLKPVVGRREYLQVSLRHENGFLKNLQIHVLVLRAFKGDRPSGLQARHLDGHNQNNTPDNLQWGTAQENQDDVDRHGRRSKGSRLPQARLKEADIPVIRALGAKGITQKQIALKFSVAKPTIQAVIARRNWKHIE